MCGYQGWFNCHNDGMGLGWTHWAINPRKPVQPGNLHVDLWPDMTELDADERFPTLLKYKDGTPATLFSSANRKTVMRHFRWMQDYGIDGIFLQRFATGLGNPQLMKHKDAVLDHVVDGAELHGRSFAIMYDLSSMKAGRLHRVKDDWNSLTADKRVTKSPVYQFHNGKPLVAVWGVGFRERHTAGRYTLAECHQLVTDLKAMGCSVMLGVPVGWRTLTRDAVDDAQLHDIINLADVVSPWTPGRYRDPVEARRHAVRVVQPDLQWCKQQNVSYLPVAFPGFSWHNLKRGEARLDQIPRQKGQFLWSQIAAFRNSGATMLYIAMFDEVDEATAIFKCTNRPPSATDVRLLDNEGLPSDHYLKIAGRARQAFQSEASVAETLPTLPGPQP